jgi:hypothetical protein
VRYSGNVSFVSRGFLLFLQEPSFLFMLLRYSLTSVTALIYDLLA